MALDEDTFKYWAPVDRNAPNNAHSFALQLIGRDKHVLELGRAAGHVTRALVAQGCTVVGVEYEEKAAAEARAIAEEVLIIDLFQADNLTTALAGRDFDVVYAGDVLEHLPDPVGVLTAARRALRPGGCVVISLPNIAHADVKLDLMKGEFRYRENGLLDRTHLRFFTRESVLQLLDDAGLEVAELRRVIRPVFETELGIDPATVDAVILQAALDDPEALTFQFVVKALASDGHGEAALAARRYRELDEALGNERLLVWRRDAEIEELRVRVAELEAHTQTERFRSIAAAEQAARVEVELQALQQTKTFRATAKLRSAYGRLRGR